VRAEKLGFGDARQGDFALLPGSPLRGAGLVFTLAPGDDLPAGQAAWTNWSGPGQPHIGAQQDGPRIELPFHPMAGEFK